MIAALERHPSAVVRAPTGAGKTTRVPPALLDAGVAGERGVVLLEPRRLAARAAARRMAEERGQALGEEIGFQVRLERCVGPRTRVEVVTEGILVRMLQDDPCLERFGVVVFDEFHERSVHTDLGLAMAREVQREVRPDLRLVVMSATLAPDPIADFLDRCPVLDCDVRTHPLAIEYLARIDDRPIPEQVAAAIPRLLDSGGGDLLAFLPGAGEIRRAARLLAGLALERDLLIVPLYGDLPAAEQDRALRPGARRRVVLATNLAETSVTVPGVTLVVDSGWARIPRRDPSAGLDRLVLERISRSAAAQRAGRAGRTAPGRVLRLFTEREERGLAELDEPEIRRLDLAAPLLQLQAWGVRDPGRFGWYEAPPPALVEEAQAALVRLGALDDAGLTPLGRRMARLPVHPRLARLVIEGHRLGHPARAALLAAVLSERPMLGAAHAPHHSDSDLLDALSAIESQAAEGASGTSFRHLLRVRDQLHRVARRALGSAPSAACDADEAIRRALLAAYPDRVARRRAQGSRSGLMVGGQGIRLAEESAVIDAPYFVCVEVAGGGMRETGEALVRAASAIDVEWLPEDRVRARTELRFDGERLRVEAVRLTEYDGLVLSDAATSIPDEAAASALLEREAAARFDQALPLAEGDARNWLERVRSLGEWMPEAGLPPFDEADIRALLPALCAGRRSFADLRRAPLVDLFSTLLAPRQRILLEREAPERIRVPSGSELRLAYRAGAPPILAVRIQELFGLAETPRVAAGRVPVLLHLLAPNGRLEQVTSDLRSFWQRAYRDVRKALRARYPRHSWPEDPMHAAPERKPKRS